jgi:3-hydroxyacyl-CoA dehydrogenase
MTAVDFSRAGFSKSTSPKVFELLAQGVKPALIENAAKAAGMPVGPLAVADEVSIELLYKIFKQTEADGISQEGPAKDVIFKMVETLDRKGKKEGKGFYDYPEGGKKTLWKGIVRDFSTCGCATRRRGREKASASPSSLGIHALPRGRRLAFGRRCRHRFDFGLGISPLHRRCLELH